MLVAGSVAQNSIAENRGGGLAFAFCDLLQKIDCRVIELGFLRLSHLD